MIAPDPIAEIDDDADAPDDDGPEDPSESPDEPPPMTAGEGVGDD